MMLEDFEMMVEKWRSISRVLPQLKDSYLLQANEPTTSQTEVEEETPQQSET